MRLPILLALLASQLLLAGQGICRDALEEGFRNPPDAARPWVYWFWMNGNITRTGIAADLEAMKRNGIGGCLIMHVKLGDIGEHKLGQMPPDGPVRFMSDEFRTLFRHAVTEADRLGLKIDMNNADGFTGSGGPWVPVERSMKKLVWTETQVAGGGKRTLQLPQPETVLGFYRDVAAVAFPCQVSLRAQMTAAQPTFSAADGTFDHGAVADGDPSTHTRIWQQGSKGQPHLLISFPEPYLADTLVVRSLRVVRGAPAATLECSDDGKTFRALGQMSLKWYPAAPTNTVRFDACTARHFRLRFHPGARQVTIGEVVLGRSNMIHYWEPKAGFTRFGEWGGGSALYTDRKLTAGGDAKSSPVSSDATPAIRRTDVLGLSHAMSPTGELSWDAPPGNWTVLRVGYTSTGIKNHPASEGGHGLECDKLHPSGIDAAFAGMLGKLVTDAGAARGRSFTHAHIDSWEVGIQNWTEDMAQTFQKRNGYELTPFLPLLVAGHAVISNDASERFLWDLRRTVLALMAENYLGRMQALCHEKGLQFSSEAAGRQQFLHNPVDLLRISDLPMGELWPHEGTPRVDCKAAASVAHLYDKPLVGAESFTGARNFANWQSHPYLLKPIGDEAFCLGVNQLVIHYYVHQAYEDFRPGFAMGPWGIHLDRMNTWWDQGKPWLAYLARCQYLLRQGHAVADVLYFPGEGAPHYFGKRESLSVPLPAGYDFDGCDRQTLLRRLEVHDGRLMLPHGVGYRYLMLSSDLTMTPVLARRLRALVDAGATVIAPPPQASPSLQGFPGCDEEVCSIAEDLRDRKRVIWGRTFEQIAAADGLMPDFAVTSTAGAANLHYIHRRLQGMDIYFVANQDEEPASVVATFRVQGKRPELWDPATGKITLSAVFDQAQEGIRLPMSLEPCGSVFVVFRTPLPDEHIVSVSKDGLPLLSTIAVAAKTPGPLVLTQSKRGELRAEVVTNGLYELRGSDGRHQTMKVEKVPAAVELAGPWTVSFPPGWNAPPKIQFERLTSWSEHDDFAIRHFSGTVTYRRQFRLPEDFVSEASPLAISLDLGRVEVIAEVTINGRLVGTLWKPPFQLDITKSVKPGPNDLAIRVTNLWSNRLIGDEHFPDDAQWTHLPHATYLKEWPSWFQHGQPRPESRRRTFSVVKHYGKNSPLLPSGLLGPVMLRAARIVAIK